MITADQAMEIRARADRNAAWRAQFVKPNGWTIITKEEQATCPADCIISNEELGKLEQFEILRDLPEKLFAYVSFHEREIASRYSDSPMQKRPSPANRDQARVHVWTGEKLGWGGVSNVYRSNFGDWRASICVIIGGATYSGTAYLGAGDYCRLRKIKSRA